MTTRTLPTDSDTGFQWSDVLELFKPITWFPPMWAFACGVVSVSGGENAWILALAGAVLAGPLICATSQAVNDWFDRHVDAINEPHRPIPSGRIPGRLGLIIAVAWTAVSLAYAWFLGPTVFYAGVVGMALAWAYSAPPFRLKRNGWIGNAAVGLCYEGLPWFTAAALMAGGMPGQPVIILALLYSIGAHGIMTLNDFKAVEGDQSMGVGSLVVRLGVRRAALVACLFMLIPQVVVVGFLLHWAATWYAVGVSALVVVQVCLMPTLIASPARKAPWYNATGVSLFVSGMMVCAFALRAMS